VSRWQEVHHHRSAKTLNHPLIDEKEAWLRDIVVCVVAVLLYLQDSAMNVAALFQFSVVFAGVRMILPLLFALRAAER
jgi:hypothetical protein